MSELTILRLSGRMKGGEDRFHDAVDISGDVVVPEAEDAVALGFKPFRAFLIVGEGGLFAMLRSIDLDDEVRGRADEIGNEISDRHLPPEMGAFRLKPL